MKNMKAKIKAVLATLGIMIGISSYIALAGMYPLIVAPISIVVFGIATFIMLYKLMIYHFTHKQK